MLRHAGSDRYALMDHPDAGLAYRELMRHADGVITDDQTVEGLGIDRRRVVGSPGRFLPREFAVAGPVLDMNAAVAATDPGARASAAAISAQKPIVGLYGKLGRAKGTAEIIATLDHASTADWQLVLLGGGVGWHRIRRQLQSSPAADRVWRLPFVAPWRVGEFIRACTVMCYLEHGFPIRQHTPSVPGEILACGASLVISREAYDKLGAARSWDEAQLTVVDSPSDVDALREAIATAIRKRMTLTFTPGRTYEDAQLSEQALADDYAALLASVVRPQSQERDLDVDDSLAAPTYISASLDVLPAADREAHERAEIETFIRWMTLDIEGRNGAAAFGIPTVVRTLAGRTPAEWADVIPVASRQIRVSRYEIDVAARIRELADQGLAVELYGCTRPVSGVVLFQKRPSLAGRLAQISDTTAQLLDLADGTRPFAEIADALGFAQDHWNRLAGHIDDLIAAEVMALAGRAAELPVSSIRLPWLESAQGGCNDRH